MVEFMPVERFGVSCPVQMQPEQLNGITNLIKDCPGLRPAGSLRKYGKLHTSIVMHSEVADATPEGHDGYIPGVLAAHIAEVCQDSAQQTHVPLNGLVSFGRGREASLALRFHGSSLPAALRAVTKEYVAEAGGDSKRLPGSYILHTTIAIGKGTHYFRRDSAFCETVAEILEGRVALGMPVISHVHRPVGNLIGEGLSRSAELFRRGEHFIGSAIGMLTAGSNVELLPGVEDPALSNYDYDFDPAQGRPVFLA